jgi:hypothetical protein
MSPYFPETNRFVEVEPAIYLNLREGRSTRRGQRACMILLLEGYSDSTKTIRLVSRRIRVYGKTGPPEILDLCISLDPFNSSF